MQVMIDNQELTLIVSQYETLPNTCLRLVCQDATPFATLTINPDHQLRPGCVAIKDWSENEGLIDQLVEQGILVYTDMDVRAGLRWAPIFEFHAQENDNA